MVSSRPRLFLAAVGSVTAHFLLRVFFGTEPFVRPLLWVSAMFFVFSLVALEALELSRRVMEGTRKTALEFQICLWVVIAVVTDLMMVMRRPREIAERRCPCGSKRKLKNCCGKSVRAEEGAQRKLGP